MVTLAIEWSWSRQKQEMCLEIVVMLADDEKVQSIEVRMPV